MFENSLVWHGAWETPQGLSFLGFHLWDQSGNWKGVYDTYSRAKSESRLLR
jgi:hypothetical protein